MSTQLTAGRTLPAGAALTRLALRLDAGVTGAVGGGYLVAAGPLDDLLGIPATALRVIGAAFLVWGLAVWRVAARERPAVGAVRAVIALNVLWVLESAAALALGLWDTTTAGAVWIVLQAITVALFAALQAAGQRGTRD